MRKFLMMAISILMTMILIMSFTTIPIYTANAADSTAYAVFNSDTGELDFIRSTETHSNSSTGTVRSISGGSYTGTIYAGFENSNDIPWSSNLTKVKMDNIKVLKPKQELSDCCLLYISTAWLKAIPVLGYARHWSVARAAKFLLPVASTGTPDWHFMETYITAIEKLTIKDVVKYKNQMIKTTKQVVNC